MTHAFTPTVDHAKSDRLLGYCVLENRSRESPHISIFSICFTFLSESVTTM